MVLALLAGCEEVPTALTPVTPTEPPPTEARCGVGEPRACERACDAGDGDACSLLAGFLAKKDEASATLLVERACSLGNQGACASLESAARERDSDACKKGSVEVCRSAIQREGARCQADVSKACDLRFDVASIALDRFCNDGSVEECSAACEGGITSACYAMAELYFDGARVSEDRPRAVAFMDRACTGGETSACERLGKLYRRACPPGYSCLIVGSRRLPENPELAASYYAKACALKGSAACDMVIELNDDEAKTVRREDLELALRASCRRGKTASCDRLRDLGASQ